MRAELETLEARIHYRFVSPGLLRRALTHSSAANESRGGAMQGHAEPGSDNEQLEFLGDSILGFLISEALVQRYPAYREGELSRLKAHLVSAAHLHGVARRIDLGIFLELGRSEEMSGGRSKKTLLVDGLEALIAAIYLDGGIDAVRCFVATHVLDAPIAGDAESGTDILPAIANFKSALQELAQARKLPQPRYTIIRERGPEHSKVFTVEVRVGKDMAGQAEGHTKKLAAQRAAREVYERLLAQPEEAATPGPWSPAASVLSLVLMTGYMNPAEFANIAECERDFWWYRGMRAMFLRLLDRHLRGRKVVRALEAGCGTGYFSAFLQTGRKWPVVPMDIAAEGLRYARTLGAQNAVQGDATALPFHAGTFDLVLSLDVFAHLAPGMERRAALEIARVLAPGGLVALRTSALNLFRSRHSCFIQESQRFTRPRLLDVFRAAGLRIRQCTYANFVLTPVAFAKFRLWEPLMRVPASSGVEPVAPWLDRLLHAPLAIESAWIGNGRGFPFGQSLLLIGEKVS